MSRDIEQYIRQCQRDLGRLEHPDLIGAFAEAAEKYADGAAFRCFGQTISFAEVEAQSRDFAAFLTGELKLARGDRIAIQLPNLLQYPIVAWGALRAGLVIVNTNPLYTPRELAYQFQDAGVNVAVVFADALPAIAAIIDDTPVETLIATHTTDMIEPRPLPPSEIRNLVALHDALAAGRAFELPDADRSLDELALLQYTGGTTGVPKGAMLTQGNVLASALMSPLSFGQDLKLTEVAIAPMPLYHIYGFAVNLIAGFLNGALSVLIPNPRDIEGLLAAMKAQPFTSFAGVNTLFTALMQHPDFDSVDFSELRWTIAGGAATVPEIAEEWQRRTGSPIYEGYGLSETTAMATVNSLAQRELGTIGPPMRGTEIKIVDADGNTLPAGEEGELLIRGPQVMRGYWQRPDATAEVLDVDGWFRTGDIAVLQDNGCLRIVDRLKDMVLVSGFNVYPNEIENVVFTHPDVIECAVVGVQDDKTGEAVKLFVVSGNRELGEQELIAFCSERLTNYKVPKLVEFVDELPKSNVGKVLRRELRGR